jgi:hypothetical protein
MAESHSLQIRPTSAKRQLTPDQKRFNTLLRQIEQARATLKVWQDAIPPYREAHHRVLAPLDEQLRSLQRQWVLALDQAPKRGWTREDHDTVGELLSEAIELLLSEQPDDEELRTLYRRHAGIGYDEAQQEDLGLFKDLAEAMTGMDLGDGEDITSEEDLFRKLDQEFRKSEAAEAAHRAKRPPRRKSTAQQRRDEEAQRATQSVREVYRKLASALHPDRVQDPQERAEKSRLMAQVNDAYAKGDLLQLLELQLRIEQVDAEHLAHADERRLKHYNSVLTEQLQELRTEIKEAEIGFQMDFSLDPFERPDPKKLGRLLDQEEADLRADLAEMQRQVKMFADPVATRRWLREQRRQLEDFDEDFF